VSPGALRRARVHDTMKDDNASERAAALINEAIDVLRRADHAPYSPVSTFMTARLRRELRRGARRLRRNQMQPRYSNLHTPEQLADIYERTAQRDEILEQGIRDYKRIALELGRVLEEHGSEALKTVDTLIMEAQRSAQEQGPGSEAAQRYRHMVLLASIGRQHRSPKRRQQRPVPRPLSLASDRSAEALYEATAAELLGSPPSSGERILLFPPDGGDFGHGRLLLRIGLGKASWTGSFARGHMTASTVCMMPDRKHLFVSAAGAGYIIDLKSRTLVEETGTHVARVIRDEPLTVFVVDHNGSSLEAFGGSGRLWKTDPIGCGGLRELALTDDDRLIGEALQSSSSGWDPFSVQLATGEVRFADGL
jgi:hypothetical protein